MESDSAPVMGSSCDCTQATCAPSGEIETSVNWRTRNKASTISSTGNFVWGALHAMTAYPKHTNLLANVKRIENDYSSWWITATNAAPMLTLIPDNRPQDVCLVMVSTVIRSFGHHN